MTTRISKSCSPRKRKRLERRKTPIQSRSEETVEMILSAAIQVFETYGYAAGTTNRIAERAGVSIGTVYQYFPSKEAIAVLLLERHLEETRRKLHEWIAHTVEEKHSLHDALREYVGGMLLMHSARPRLQHILLEETPLPDRVHEALQSAERQAAKTVASVFGLYAEIRHRRPEHAAFFVVQAVESLTHRFAAHPENAGIDRETFAEELVAMLEAYLTHAGGEMAIHSRNRRRVEEQ